MYQLKVMLNDIVDRAFMDDPKLKSYKAFYIEVLSKDYKGRHGDYNPNDRHIRLMNTYRDEKKLVVTAIHELAHHINHMQGNKDIHGDGFYSNYKKLLYTALDMNIFNKEEYISMVNEYRDSQSEYKVVKMIKDYAPKDAGYKKDQMKIIIFGGYEIKETLKEKGFKYNKISKAWEKEISKDVKDTEEKWAKEQHLNYKISGANQYIVKADNVKTTKEHYIVFQVYNSFKIKELLKEMGMHYESSSKTWELKIKADSEAKEKTTEIQTRLRALKVNMVAYKKDINGLCCLISYE